MNIYEPTLSICIPTYNQPERLRKTLDSLKEQDMQEVEIVIRDDSTMPESKKVVDMFPSLPIRYISGEKIGLDAADMFLIEHSFGKYVWWFGDDEMGPGAVAHVKSILKQNPDIIFVWINSKSYDGQIAVNLGESHFFRDGNEALASLADMLGFLSALIFKREKALPGIPLAQKFIGTNFGGLYIPLYVISEPGKIYYLSEPYIISLPKEPEKEVWYDRFDVFVYVYYDIVRSFKGRFSDWAIREALRKNFKSIWRGMLVYRVKGIEGGLGKKNIDLWKFAKYYWSFAGFWVVLPFLFVPRNILIRFYRLYKYFFPEITKRIGK